MLGNISSAWVAWVFGKFLCAVSQEVSIFTVVLPKGAVVLLYVSAPPDLWISAFRKGNWLKFKELALNLGCCKAIAFQDLFLELCGQLFPVNALLGDFYCGV